MLLVPVPVVLIVEPPLPPPPPAVVGAAVREGLVGGEAAGASVGITAGGGAGADGMVVAVIVLDGMAVAPGAGGAVMALAKLPRISPPGFSSECTLTSFVVVVEEEEINSRVVEYVSIRIDRSKRGKITRTTRTITRRKHRVVSQQRNEQKSERTHDITNWW